MKQKYNLKKIETDFIKLFELEKIDSSVFNKYSIDTINGTYDLWFDYTGMESIFGRFASSLILEDSFLTKNINPFSGKLNYHGFEVNSFIFDMQKIQK